MKNNLLACLIAIVYVAVTLPTQAQTELTLPTNGGKIEYLEIIDLPDVSKSELKKRCKKWFATAYKSAKDVIQSETEEEIIGKGAFYYNFIFMMSSTSTLSEHTIEVSFKDGKYRCKISNLTYTYKETGTNPVDMMYETFKTTKNKTAKKSCRVQLEAIDKEVKSLIESLKKAMSTKDEW